MSINRVNISGNLTRDPELRATQGGTSVLSFGVAVKDRRRNPQSGEWEDVPNFVDCIVFGNRAEPLSRFLSKGAKVAIEGKLRFSQWQDKQTGQNRSKLEVVVDECEFFTQRQQGAQAPQQQAYQTQPQQAPQQPRYAPQQAPQAYQPQPQQAPQQPRYAPQQAPQAYQPQPQQYAPNTGYQQAPQAYQQPAPQPAPQPVQQQMPMTQAPAMDVYDEDIPF